MLLNRCLTVAPGRAGLAPRPGLGGGHRAGHRGARRPGRPAGRGAVGPRRAGPQADARRGAVGRVGAPEPAVRVARVLRLAPVQPGQHPAREAGRQPRWTGGSRDAACGRCACSAARARARARRTPKAAAALGPRDRLARHALVYGGASVGLMGTVADAALAAGGEVVGVIPQHLVDREVAHPGLTELRITTSMHERKAMMADAVRRVRGAARRASARSRSSPRS